MTRRLLGILSVASMLGFVSSYVYAADMDGRKLKRGPEAMNMAKGGAYDPDRRLELMTQNLKLTKEQQDKISPILKEEFTQLEALKGNDTYNRDQRRAKLQELNQATFEKIKPILTPEQMKRHDDVKQIIKERRSKQRASKPASAMAKGPSRNDPEKRLKNLANDLGLSAEQQASIKPLIEDEFAQLDKLKGNDTINRDQRREKLQELNKSTSEKIKAVLTPEQVQKYELIRQKISERRALKKSDDPPNMK
jgi:Spy/CpxP family protein refolding chaperone